MKLKEALPILPLLAWDTVKDEALALYPLESLQHLDAEGALRCQMILGHGGTFGIWETPETMIQHMSKSMRRIDMRRRIIDNVNVRKQTSAFFDERISAGVLWLTRLALLMRLGPAGIGGTARRKSLDASTVTDRIYQHFAKLVALGITIQVKNFTHSNAGFISELKAEDLHLWQAKEGPRTELKRLTQLHVLGLWTDAPKPRDFKNNTTAVRGPANASTPENKRASFLPIPDDYLSVMGPRVLWLIRDLGPNLIHLLETLNTMRGTEKTSPAVIKRLTSHYFECNVWRDRNGQVIEKPPFDLKHGSKRGVKSHEDFSKHDPFEWPPRHWSSVQALAVSLQSAHLWLALLVMAARIGEIATLGRDCVEYAGDGQTYANGKTYKPSRNLAGKERDWPIPDILVTTFGQQVRLVEACESLASVLNDTEEMRELLGNNTHLWASLGASGSADPTKKLATYDQAIRNLAVRISLSPKPGGKNIHPHRFRKTLARLAGLAIDGSQKVLMLLLGHEDVTTTLGYMQSDPGFAKEVDDITRELRIMRGEALVEDMRAALRGQNSLPYGGHGGGGAPVLADAVRDYEEKLHRSGQEWGAGTARELSVLLTNNGESARLISAHVVCTKTAGEVGLCSSKKGAIVTSNCQTECRNHIEDKTGRRDTERVIPILVKQAQENIANNDWLPLARDRKQLEQELKRYDDIGAHWRADPEVRAILVVAK